MTGLQDDSITKCRESVLGCVPPWPLPCAGVWRRRDGSPGGCPPNTARRLRGPPGPRFQVDIVAIVREGEREGLSAGDGAIERQLEVFVATVSSTPWYRGCVESEGGDETLRPDSCSHGVEGVLPVTTSLVRIDAAQLFQLLESTFDALIEKQYRLEDQEVDALIPTLLDKSGQAKERFRTAMRGLLAKLPRLCPYVKFSPLLFQVSTP